MILQSGKCVEMPERVGHDEIVEKQEKGEFCRINDEELPFQISHERLLLRLSPPEHQIMVPRNRTKRILYLAHYTIIDGHRGRRRMYRTLRRSYYWPVMAMDWNGISRNCIECAKERSLIQWKDSKRKTHWKTLPWISSENLYGRQEEPLGTSYRRSFLEISSKNPAVLYNRLRSNSSLCNPFGVHLWPNGFGIDG